VLQKILLRLGLAPKVAQEAPAPAPLSPTVAQEAPVPAPLSPTVAQEAPVPAPFTPKGKLKPVLFVHIPKTAGSSWNRVLEQAYGEDNFLSHAEYHIAVIKSGQVPPVQADCITGHIAWNNWHRQQGADAYAPITVLRDPWKRLVSHINWVDRFNRGEALAGQGNNEERYAHIVALLAETEWLDRESIIKLRDRANEKGRFAHFDNMQCRMLFTGRNVQMTAEATPAFVDSAIKTLEGFAGVGFCEDGLSFLEGFLADIGRPVPEALPHENRGDIRALTADNDIAREVLAPWFEGDTVLYNTARRAYGEKTATRRG